jgi:hypothetical protein
LAAGEDYRRLAEALAGSGAPVGEGALRAVLALWAKPTRP